MTAHKVWVNGALVDASSPSIPATDHGFLLGDGVFDSLIALDGSPVFLERHLRRLRHGIDRLGLSEVPSDSELGIAITQLLDASQLVDARLRITVTPGAGPSARVRGTAPVTVISATGLASPPESVALCTVPWARNERSPLAGIKSTSWGDNAMILRIAVDAGFDNALLCDSRGRLSECTTSNVFAVFDQHVATPSLEAGCLPGIIREVLIEDGIAEEVDLFPTDLDRATEVFVTSSTTGAVPVRRIDDRTFPVPGPVTDRIRAHLRALQAHDSRSAR